MGGAEAPAAYGLGVVWLGLDGYEIAVLGSLEIGNRKVPVFDFFGVVRPTLNRRNLEWGYL